MNRSLACLILAAVAGLGPSCGGGSVRSTADKLRASLEPPPPPPDTIPEMLDYAAVLGVNVADMKKLPEGVLYDDAAAGGDSATAATGDSVEIPRVVGVAVGRVLRRRPHREFIHVRLAQQLRATCAELGENSRVVRRNIVFQNTRTAGRHGTRDEHVVFQRVWNSRQHGCVQFARHVYEVRVAVRIQLLVVFLNALRIVREQTLGSQLPLRERLTGRCDSESKICHFDFTDFTLTSRPCECGA